MQRTQAMSVRCQVGDVQDNLVIEAGRREATQLATSSRADVAHGQAPRWWSESDRGEHT
jgi:hypothetical protein